MRKSSSEDCRMHCTGSACIDTGAALSPLLSRGTRVHPWQSAQGLWPDMGRLQLPLDYRCRPVLPYHEVKHAADGTDPPRMGAKNTTTRNHPMTPQYCSTCTTYWTLNTRLSASDLYTQVMAGCHLLLYICKSDVTATHNNKVYKKLYRGVSI